MQRIQARLEADTRKSGTSRSCYYGSDTVEEDESNYSHNNESGSGMHSRALSTVRLGPPWLSLERFDLLGLVLRRLSWNAIAC